MPKKTTSADQSRGLGPAQPMQESIDEGTAAAQPDSAPDLDENRIRDLAYSYWLSEGHPEGRDAEHWSRAEEEIARLGREQRPDTSTSPTTSIEAEDDATSRQGGRPAGAAKATKSAKPPGQATQTFGQSR